MNHSPLHAADTPEQSSSRFVQLAAICSVASLGGLLFGFDTAVISGTISGVESRFELTKFLVGWFGSSALLGCMAGALVAGKLSDGWGRKPALGLAAVLFLVSAIFSVIPPTFAILILARIVGGIGVGIASVVAPTYIAEFSPANLRGRLIAFYQLSIVVGILLAYLSNYCLQSLSQYLQQTTVDSRLLDWIVRDEVWRSMFGAEIIPALLFLVLIAFSPESPRWLVLYGNIDEGRRLLQRIQSSSAAAREFAAILTSTGTGQARWNEIFRPEYRRALIVGIGLSLFGQLTGVNVIIYFGPSILESAGFATDGALAFQAAFGIINLLFTIVALMVIDSWGRRPLLLGGMFVVSCTLLAIASLFYLQQYSSSQAINYGIVGAIAVYIAAVALSICAVIWVLTPEIFPNRVRAQGVAIATFVNWTTNALSVLWFPPFIEAASMHAAFLVFSAICFGATCFFYLVVHETRQRSLEEIGGTMHSSAPLNLANSSP